MLDDFLVRAVLGGIGVAAMAGPLGTFVVWRRMAYFGEALANSALLGIVFGIVLHLDVMLGVVLFALLMALLLALLERQRTLPVDSALSILAHGALAVGLIVLGMVETVRVDLMGYLFGDVLAVSRGDLGLIAVMLAIVLAVLVRYWRPLLSLSVDADIAAVEGVPVARMRLLLTLLVAAVIAAGMKVVGILLIISLLVIPAATARRLAATPERMAMVATLVGIVAVIAGLAASWQLDWPAGPAVVAVAVTLFAAAQLVPQER